MVFSPRSLPLTITTGPSLSLINFDYIYESIRWHDKQFQRVYKDENNNWLDHSKMFKIII